MGVDRSQDYKPWFLFFAPCLLWGCVPTWADLCMMTSFVLSQVLYYSSEHLKGLLFLCTLMMLLWTRNILLRWYRKQIMTMDFFGKLLYLGMSIILSLTALFLVWLPLQDAYDCLTRSSESESWKDWVFLFIAFCLASTALSQTDICISPEKVNDTGFPNQLKRLAVKLARLLVLLWRGLKNTDYFNMPCDLLNCVGMREAPDCAEEVFDSDSDVCDLQDEPTQCFRPPTPQPCKKQPSDCSPSCEGQPSLATGSSNSNTDSPCQDRCNKKSAPRKNSEYSIYMSTSEMLSKCIAPGGGPCIPRPRSGNACAGLHKLDGDLDAGSSVKSGGGSAGSFSQSLRSVIESTSALLGRCVLPCDASDSRKEPDSPKTKEGKGASSAAKNRAGKGSQSDDSQVSDQDEEVDTDAENEAGSDYTHTRGSRSHSESEAMSASGSSIKSQVAARRRAGKHNKRDHSTASSIKSSQRSEIESTSSLLCRCMTSESNNNHKKGNFQKKKEKGASTAKYRGQKDNQSDDSQGGDDDEDDEDDADANSGMLTSSSISEENEAGSNFSYLRSVSQSMTSSSRKPQVEARQKKENGNSQKPFYNTFRMLKKCFVPSNHDVDMTQDDGSKKKKMKSVYAGYRGRGGEGDDSDSQDDLSTSSSMARSSQEDVAWGSDSTDSSPKKVSLTSTSSSVRRPRLPHDGQRGKVKTVGSRDSENFSREELSCSESCNQSEDAGTSSSAGTSGSSEQRGSNKKRGRSASMGQRFTMNLRPRVPPRQSTQSSSVCHRDADPPRGRRPFNGTGSPSASRPRRTVVVENRPKSRCKNSSKPKYR